MAELFSGPGGHQACGVRTLFCPLGARRLLAFLRFFSAASGVADLQVASRRRLFSALGRRKSVGDSPKAQDLFGKGKCQMGGQKPQARMATSRAARGKHAEGSGKRCSIVIENIEEMRLRQGIRDDDLRQTIARLQVGDFVKLTFSTSKMTCTGETLLVCVTKIKTDMFLGRLAGRPALPALSALRQGSLVTFSSEHIHSI